MTDINNLRTQIDEKISRIQDVCTSKGQTCARQDQEIADAKETIENAKKAIQQRDATISQREKMIEEQKNNIEKLGKENTAQIGKLQTDLTNCEYQKKQQLQDININLDTALTAIEGKSSETTEGPVLRSNKGKRGGKSMKKGGKHMKKRKGGKSSKRKSKKH